MDEAQYLQDLKIRLLKAENWRKVIFSKDWVSKVPNEAGVYVFRHSNEIVYVGETGNLQGRMNDLFDSRHHTVRRTIGQKYYSSHDGYIQATIKNKFPEHIEILVNDYITSNLLVAFLTVSLGRKELEELIESELVTASRLNKRGKRK